MVKCLGITQVDSSAVWDPGSPISCNGVLYENLNKPSDVKKLTFEDDINGKVLTSSKLLEIYGSIWKCYYNQSICTSDMKLLRCEWKLYKITDDQFRDCLYNFIHFSITSSMNTYTTNITTLIHILHVLSTPHQESKKKWLLLELNYSLENMTEKDLYSLYNEYIGQLVKRKLKVTKEDLFIEGINPYYILQLKLCYSEILIKQKHHRKHKDFLFLNEEYVVSMSKEIKARKDCKTMSQTCIFLLQKISLHHQLEEDCITLFIDLIRILAEDNVYETFQIYLQYADKLNSIVTFENLCKSIGKLDKYQKLQLQFCYCEMLIKRKKRKSYEELMVQNLHLFIDVTTEGCSGVENRTTSHYCEKPCDKINIPKEKRYWITELTRLLSHLLHKLPEDRLNKTINHYMLLVKQMKSDITPKYLHSVKTDPFLELVFKLFWCRKLINEGHADGNIVNRCLNNFYHTKFQENKTEFISNIISMTDFSETSLLTEFLQTFLRKNLKTVTSMSTKTHGNEETGQNKKWNSTPVASTQDLIYAHCACIFSGKKMKNVDIKQYLRKLNIKGPEDESEVNMQSEQIKLLILLILLRSVTALGHKSAKLKKYLTLKYEYHMASMYLLWRSGDIEVHPGPPWRTKQLEHNSERKRKWLQDINTILLKLYWGNKTQSIPKNIWETNPDYWPTNKLFYDTKNASKKRRQGIITKKSKVSDEEMFTILLECLEKTNVVIPQTFQSEILAWRNKNVQLLHILEIFRIETEKIKSALLNLYLSNLEDDDVKKLQGIRVNITKSIVDPKKMEDLLKNDKRQKKPAELVAYITRDLASTLCKLARGKDHMKKCDRIWDPPTPNHWPKDVPFFNPCNRGSYKAKDKCSDRKLVDTFLNLQNLQIPPNLEQIVDAYKNMYNSTDTVGKKKNKDDLCRLYTIQSNLTKLDCSLQKLYKEGLFSREVHVILNQWWDTQSVDENAEHVLKNAIVRSDERPHITVDITHGFESEADLRYISYTIPIKDAYVLHIRCTTVPNQSSHWQALTGSLTTANNPENFEESVLSSDITHFQSSYDFGNQTDIDNINSDSAMDEDNRHKTSDLKRKGKPFSVTHQYQRSHNELESDQNWYRSYREYVKSLPVIDFVNSSNNSTGEDIGGNIGTFKVKRQNFEEDEEPVNKRLKTKYDQNNGGSLEPIHIRTSNQREICSDNVLYLKSLEFSNANRSNANNIGIKCERTSSIDSESFKQVCEVESINCSNQKGSLGHINEINNNDNQMDQIEELEECLKRIDDLSCVSIRL